MTKKKKKGNKTQKREVKVDDKSLKKTVRISVRDLDFILSSLHNSLTGYETRSKRRHSATSLDFYSHRSIVVPSIRERVALLSVEELTEFRRARGHLVKQIFGTQEPTLRLRSDPTSDGYTAGVPDVPVLSVNFQSIHDQGSLAAFFDEYKMVRGHVHWFSWLSDTVGAAPSVPGIAVGVIDYDDNTSVTTLANLMAYDTHKVMSPGTSKNTVHSWPWHSQGIPDLQWVSTSTDFTPCYFKWYTPGANLGTIATAYSLWFDVQVEFRQIEA